MNKGAHDGPSPRSWVVVGLTVALVSFGIDRLFKWAMLGPFAIAEKGKVTVTSFFDLVLAWNHGISYGLFQAESMTGRLFLVAFALAVVIGLTVWLIRAHSLMLSLALGLVIGGAIGNVYDRFAYGAVADFFSFHAWGYYWYIFNIADVWITFGIVMILIDSFRPERQSPSLPDQEL